MKIRVYYEDTDSGGVVYHTKYLAFCERARSEFFFKNGVNFEEDGFVVRELKATFFAPAKLGDLVEVKSEIESLKKSIAVINQKIFKEDKLLFEAKIKLVFLKNGKIAKIPEEYQKILNEFS